jgi:hypothetical protein
MRVIGHNAILRRTKPGMKASDFEHRRQTLLHLLLVGIAPLTYIRYSDDIGAFGLIRVTMRSCRGQ